MKRLPLSRRTPAGKVDFAQDFFGRETFLTVSGQLNVEAYCLALSKVYTFGPTFRAENSNTSRHLAEFWMIEPEIAFADLSDNATLAEAGVQAAMGYSQNLYQIATEAQAQFAKLVEESHATYTKGATAWVDEASKSAPAGSEAAVNAFRQGLAASTAAFGQFNQASKQVVSLADASVRAAAANASKVVATTKGRKSA